MKKHKIENRELREALAAASKVVSRGSGVIHYSSVHFTGNSIVALDGDVLMRAQVPGMNLKGSVAAEPFLGLVQSLKAGALEISGKKDHRQVRVTSDNSGRWTMPVLECEPDPIDTSEGEYKVELTEGLMYLLRQADKVVDNIQREFLHGVIFWVENGRCRAMATNGKCMIITDCPESTLPETEKGILLRLPMVQRIAQLAEPGDRLSLSAEGDKYRWVCESGNCTLVSLGAESAHAKRLSTFCGIQIEDDNLMLVDAGLRGAVARAIHVSGYGSQDGLVQIQSEKEGLAVRADADKDAGEVLETDVKWTNERTMINPDYLDWIVSRAEQVGKFPIPDEQNPDELIAFVGLRETVTLVALMCQT